MPAVLRYQALSPADRRAFARLARRFHEWELPPPGADPAVIQARVRGQHRRDARVRPRLERLLRRLRARYRCEVIDLAGAGGEVLAVVFECGVTAGDLAHLGVACSDPRQRFNC
jgi:hypothetical protein